MFYYLLKRFLQFIPVFFGITVLVFFLIHLIPGRPSFQTEGLNPKISMEYYEKLYKFYGFDRPIPEQYVLWLKNISRLDFGDSIVDGRPVWERIKERAPVTLIINFLSLMLIFLVGIPLGVSSAVKKGKLFDNFVTFLVFIGYSLPSFWAALILMHFLCVHLGWFPLSGIHSLNYESLSTPGKIGDFLWHITLPVIISSALSLASITRYMRQSMNETLNKRFIVALKAKGLSFGNILYRHALKNACLPIITLIGLSIPALLSGSVILESIFSIPGMGRLFFEAVFTRDYFLIMGLLVISAFLVFIGNLVADIGYVLLDPRIRYSKK